MLVCPIQECNDAGMTDPTHSGLAFVLEMAYCLHPRRRIQQTSISHNAIHTKSP